MDIREKAKGQLNALERVLHKVPGFRGYYEKELRRDSDRRQREFIVAQLRQVKSGMNKVIQAAARQKDFDLLREYDLFVKELDKVSGAVRYADGGYSGFFDLLKIREAELDRVYEQDALAVETAATLLEGFKSLAAAPLASEALVPLRAALTQLEGLLATRTNLLQGFAQGEGK